MNNNRKNIIIAAAAAVSAGTLAAALHILFRTGNVILLLSDGAKEELTPDLLKKIKKCCEGVLREEKIKYKTEVSLSTVSNEEIKELNFKYRGKNSVTDVLSFPMSENGVFDIDPENGCKMLGDIVISTERAKEQAVEYGHSFEREMCFLAVHSMLHLLGYDHEISEEEEKIMFAKQAKVLDRLGISRLNYITDENQQKHKRGFNE